MSAVWFITGTDTGVGKTVFTALLARWLRSTGCRVHAVKPLASGGREDALLLRQALGGSTPLDAINPWHFRAALAPCLAARAEGRTIRREEVLGFLRSGRRDRDVLLVEGAGGLLSPLGEDFDARDLIRAIPAIPVVVAPNRLGAINQVLLTVAAVPRRAAPARVVLMSPRRTNRIARTNADFLRGRLGAEAVLEVPWYPRPDAPSIGADLRRRLARWWESAGP